MPHVRPASVTHYPTNVLGLLAMLACTAWLLVRTEISPDVGAPLLMLATAAPILLLDVMVRKVHRRSSTGIDWSLSRSVDVGRLATKLLGLGVAVGLVLGAYTLTPEYAGDFYGSYYSFLWWFAPPLIVIAPFYFAWMDTKLTEPRDKYWHLGALVTGQEGAEGAEALDLLRGWVIKGFFIPLMYIYMIHNIDSLRNIVAKDRTDFMHWFDCLWSLGFLVDVTFTTMGYLLSVRLVDTHLRSAEPTMTGWVVAMLCYQPFFGLIGGQYLAYDNGFYWGEWLEGWPTLRIAWGIGLLLTTVVFSGSTIAFGCRFSNLTNRGVITGGFYRFSKHPAYWSKLVSFFMIFIPMVSRGSWWVAAATVCLVSMCVFGLAHRLVLQRQPGEGEPVTPKWYKRLFVGVPTLGLLLLVFGASWAPGVYDVVRDTVMLSLLGGVYFLRARTEEQHLSVDPDYVRYALWMNEHGVLAFLGRWFPALQYRAPTGWQDSDAATSIEGQNVETQPATHAEP